MTPYLQQSALQGRVGTARGEYQQLLRHHKAQCRPQQSSLQMDPAHQRPQLAVEFHRSAGISIPPIRARVMRCRSDKDGRTQEDRARAVRRCHRLLRAVTMPRTAGIENSLEEQPARGRFTTELAAPLTRTGSGTGYGTAYTAPRTVSLIRRGVGCA